MAPPAISFLSKGSTNHETVYLVTAGGGQTHTLDAADLLQYVMPGTPLERFFQQVVPDQATARKLIFGMGLDGEHTVKPALIGEASIQGLTSEAHWDLDADTDGANGLRLIVTSDSSGTANLRIRVKHTIDR